VNQRRTEHPPLPLASSSVPEGPLNAYRRRTYISHVECLVPRMLSDNYLALMKQHAPLAPTEWFFNIDEFDVGNWEERETKSVLGPR
jgi:hypothetical protein